MSYGLARRDTHQRMSYDAPLDVARQAASAAMPDDLRAALSAHHASAWAWALTCCRGDRHSAHDVLHDVYVNILAGRAAFAGRSAFKTWLFGCIRLTAMATRRRRLLLDILYEPIGPLAETIAAPSAAPGASPALMAALAALPRRQSEIVALVFGHDLSLEEAAAIMGVSVGSARQHHTRAKRKLHAALTPEQETDYG